MSTLPGPLSLSSGFPFVGRESELVTLRSLVPWAPGEGRRIALVGGEAGSGKSRLVREFAGEAAESGANVLYGACDAVVHPPYGPFVEALGELRAGTGAATDPDTERHRLHTAVADLLERTGRERPVVLVLEDAHWADAPTLGLLRHLARAGGRARLLLVATFRDTETDMPDALSEMLADLRRSDDVVRLRLGGLSGDDVTEFVRRAAGEEPVPELRRGHRRHDRRQPVPRLRAVAQPGRRRTASRSGAAASGSPARSRSSRRRRACARWSRAGWRACGRPPPTCSSWRPRRAPSSSSRCCARWPTPTCCRRSRRRSRAA